MKIKQLTYASALAPHWDASCVREIWTTSMRSNKTNHVTGMLLFANDSFLQVLEGLPDTVDDLYTTIRSDPRHTAAVKILDLDIPERQFGHWSMGYASLSPDEADRLIGRNDFFTSGHCLNELDSGAVRGVLAQFREGGWRQSLE